MEAFAGFLVFASSFVLVIGLISPRGFWRA